MMAGYSCLGEELPIDAWLSPLPLPKNKELMHMFYVRKINKIFVLHLPCNSGKSHQLPFFHFCYLNTLSWLVARREGLDPHHGNLGNSSSKIHRKTEIFKVDLQMKKRLPKPTNYCLHSQEQRSSPF